MAKVKAKLPHKLTVAGHTAAWQHYKVRPPAGATKAEATDGKYCVYDAAHKDYLYTDAWVEKLAKELANPAKFQEVTGIPPAVP